MQSKGDSVKNLISLLLLLAVMTAVPAVAEDYVVEVNGIVCEFCSLGVRKKVSRLPFIDRSKYDDGVEVDIENQMVTIAVTEGAKLDKTVLFKAIESAGYNPVELFLLTEGGDRVAYRP